MERVKEGRLGGSIPDPYAVEGKFIKGTGGTLESKSAVRGVPLFSRNGPTLGSLLSLVTGWRQPCGMLGLNQERMDFREKQLRPFSLRSIFSL